MGFKIKTNIQHTARPLMIKKGVITNGVTVADGALCRDDGAGRITLAATGEAVAYIAHIPDGVARVGTTTPLVEITLRVVQPGDVLAIAQGNIADADAQPGDYLDLATGSASIAAASNNDFRVHRLDAAQNIVYVVPMNLAFGGARGIPGPQGTPG
jgi:hypothetical protein